MAVKSDLCRCLSKTGVERPFWKVLPDQRTKSVGEDTHERISGIHDF